MKLSVDGHLLLHQLPVDCLREIFNRVQVGDLSSLQLVNKQFCDIVSGLIPLPGIFVFGGYGSNWQVPACFWRFNGASWQECIRNDYFAGDMASLASCINTDARGRIWLVGKFDSLYIQYDPRSWRARKYEKIQTMAQPVSSN